MKKGFGPGLIYMVLLSINQVVVPSSHQQLKQIWISVSIDRLHKTFTFPKISQGVAGGFPGPWSPRFVQLCRRAEVLTQSWWKTLKKAVARSSTGSRETSAEGTLLLSELNYESGAIWRVIWQWSLGFALCRRRSGFCWNCGNSLYLEK